MDPYDAKFTFSTTDPKGHFTTSPLEKTSWATPQTAGISSAERSLEKVTWVSAKAPQAISDTAAESTTTTGNVWVIVLLQVYLLGHKFL
jgi:hypothetical protein